MNNVKGKPLLVELENHKSDYTTKRILKILWQLCKAVRHLKAKDIIWCNFNHDNIIYDGDNVVICGFSESRVKVKRDLKQAQSILGLRGNLKKIFKFSGDPRYASPEMIEEKYYGLRHDVWGLGVLAFFLFAGKFPFDGETDMEICEDILKNEPDWETLIKRKVDPKIIKLIKGMLIKKAGSRFTIRQAMGSKVFKYLEQEETLSLIHI